MGKQEYTETIKGCSHEPSTYFDFRDLQYKVNKRLILDEYKVHGVKNPKWDDQAVDFLETVTKKLSGKGGMSYRKMAELGKDVDTKGLDKLNVSIKDTIQGF